MASKGVPLLPVGPLPDLMRWWQAEHVEGLIIGGLAVALLGRPRVTRDIDAMVLLAEERWPGFVEAGREFGFVPRLPDVLAFAREGRMVLVRHRATGIDVDIALGCLPFEEEALARAQRVQVAGASLPLPSPEDLIIMKAVAHRDRDLLDIDGLLAAHPKLDVRRIRQWTQAFAEAMEMPELYDDLDRKLAAHAPKKRRKGKG